MPAKTRSNSTAAPAQATVPGGLILPRDRSDLRLQIEYRPAASLKRRNRTVRKHSPEQIAALAKSLLTFGPVVPIVIDRAGYIVSGHARTEAALLAGLEQVPVICIDHLSELEARAFAIADNKLGEMAEWDFEVLTLELEEFVSLDLSGELGFDLGALGFSTPELDILLEGADGTGPAETVELPDPGARPVSAAGDLWLLGRHRLLCGNALEAADHASLLGDEKVRLVLSDPPYNVKVNGHVSGTGRHREFAMASGEMSSAEFSQFLRQALALMRGASVDGAILMVFMDWRHVAQLIDAGEAEGLALQNLCVWAKTSAGLGGLYRSAHELAAIFKSGKAPHVNNVQLGKYGRSRSNVWTYAGVNTFRKGRDADLADHPTVKPTALLMDAIRDVTHHGDLVLDPFGGSGSTLLAAEKTGRRARLIELDPLYCDVAIRRWQALTGEPAILERTGQTFAEIEAESGAEVETEADAATAGAGEVDHGAA